MVFFKGHLFHVGRVNIKFTKMNKTSTVHVFLVIKTFPQSRYASWRVGEGTDKNTVTSEDHWRRVTLETNVSRVADSTVAWGREFQSCIVFGTNVLLHNSVLHLTRSYINSCPLLPDLVWIGFNDSDLKCAWPLVILYIMHSLDFSRRFWSDGHFRSCSILFTLALFW